MKILFLAPQPFYTERGTPIAVKLAVTALCRDGHQVDLLTYHQGQDIDIPGMRLFRAGRPPGAHAPGRHGSADHDGQLWRRAAFGRGKR